MIKIGNLFKSLFLLILLNFGIFKCDYENHYKIICYYTNWAQYRFVDIKYSKFFYTF